MTHTKSLDHVQYLWDDEAADKLTGLDRLVYRSNKLGEDLTLTNTGGGNTSSKVAETDPLTGQSVEVLWVKGSGGDLRTATVSTMLARRPWRSKTLNASSATVKAPVTLIAKRF